MISLVSDSIAENIKFRILKLAKSNFKIKSLGG